jgi:hypothetical protein
MQSNLASAFGQELCRATMPASVPQEHLQSGLDTWAAYMADGRQPDPLVQLAMIQLEKAE